MWRADVEVWGQIERFEVSFSPSTEGNPPNDPIDDDRNFTLNQQHDDRESQPQAITSAWRE
jgi:hypothetical protein